MRRGRFSSLRILMATLLLAAVTALLQPSSALASGREERTKRNDINIAGDSQFNPANGVRSGSGTRRDPYVISGWNVRNIVIRDTSAYVVIKDNTVAWQLVLNWNGDRVTVVNNDIGDLRVNQNVKRTGDATSGRIANNTFGIVGQLRHFDGVFENNVVKGRTSLFNTVFANKSVQFDGFHGSTFRNNTINGYVEVRLHGHHHGSSFDENSHYHGAGHGGHAAHGDGVDHTNRYHQVFVENNRIIADGPYALLYTDTAHVANDRTAASETNQELNKNHVHYTRVQLTGNKLVGAGLMVNVFNATDQRHTGTRTGLINIRNNEISLEREARDAVWWNRKDGITINRAVDAVVKVENNVVHGEPLEERDLLDDRFGNDAGILLNDLDKGRVYLRNNTVTNLLYGVRAAQMTESVHWWIAGLVTKAVTQPVYWDNSVRNQPRYRP